MTAAMMREPDRMFDLPARFLGMIIGSVAGPYGILAGFVLGVVADRFAREWRRILLARRFLADPRSCENPGMPDAAAALIGAAVQIAAEGPPRFAPARKAALMAGLARMAARAEADDLGPFLVRVAEEAFGSPDRVDAGALLESCRTASGREERLSLLDHLVAVATTPAADADPPALRRVRDAADRLGLGPGDAGEILRRYRAEDDEPYRILGLEPGAALSDVKRVYRRLAAAFHPDTAAGLGEEQLLAMAEAFRRINGAYLSLTGKPDRPLPPSAEP